MAPDLESHCRTIRIADVDPQAVVDVDDRHATIVDVQPIEAAVVDGNPPALVEPHDEVCPGYQRVCDPDVRAQVTPNDYVVARCESAFGSLVSHGQHGWG
ncbi:hypothetical protein MHEI_43940 [Mycobacterium heidelbergense]|nr:hypothetical protein MHEI_43940 [Mycobacterium heidelbergense]